MLQSSDPLASPVCVALQGNFRYKAGQYVFVNIPSLSLFQWHPFSLSSSPYQDTVMVHIRVLGNWTKALYVCGSALASAANLAWRHVTSLPRVRFQV